MSEQSPCPQCGDFTGEFRDGVCIYCSDQNQMELDLHNAEFAHWNSLAEAGAQLAEFEATSKEAVMRMREQADTFTAQLAQVTAERDALKIWHDLGKLTVAIANGEALPSASEKLDDNPVNCVSFLLAQRDGLNARLDAADRQLSDYRLYSQQSDEYVLMIGRLLGCADGDDTPEMRIAELRKDSERLGIVDSNSWTIECYDIPTGGDDTDIGWRVIEYYMAKPNEREIGSGKTPREAIDAAIGAQP